MYFKKAKTHDRFFTFIDTPGLSKYTSKALKGIGMADAAVLVFTAELDTSLDSSITNIYKYEPNYADLQRTKELALIAFGMGVKQIIIAFNVNSGYSIDQKQQRSTQEININAQQAMEMIFS